MSLSAVMREYLKQPEVTAKALSSGWLHTGDLARMDENGYIYIVDRNKELIIRGGYNVYPRFMIASMITRTRIWFHTKSGRLCQ